MAYDAGDLWIPELTVRNSDGILTAATVSVQITSPSGIVTSPTAATASVGIYTTDVLLTEPGQWVATWTVSGAVVGVEQQQIIANPLGALLWKPTPADVHAIIPRRPQFTAMSDPSADDVQTIIDGLASDLATDAAAVLTPAHVPLARWAISLGAAAYVESGFFPEQNETDSGMSATLYRRYLDTLNRLRNVLGLSGEAGGSSAGGGGSVRGAFTIGRLPEDYTPTIVYPAY